MNERVRFEQGTVLYSRVLHEIQAYFVKYPKPALCGQISNELGFPLKWIEDAIIHLQKKQYLRELTKAEKVVLGLSQACCVTVVNKNPKIGWTLD